VRGGTRDAEGRKEGKGGRKSWDVHPYRGGELTTTQEGEGVLIEIPGVGLTRQSLGKFRGKKVITGWVPQQTSPKDREEPLTQWGHSDFNREAASGSGKTLPKRKKKKKRG